MSGALTQNSTSKVEFRFEMTKIAILSLQELADVRSHVMTDCLWPDVPNKEEIFLIWHTGSQLRIRNDLRLQIGLH